MKVECNKMKKFQKNLNYTNTIVQKNLHKHYFKNNEYWKKVADEIIYDKNSEITAKFKDNLIWNENMEFLTNYYKTSKIQERLYFLTKNSAKFQGNGKFVGLDCRKIMERFSAKNMSHSTSNCSSNASDEKLMMKKILNSEISSNCLSSSENSKNHNLIPNLTISKIHFKNKNDIIDLERDTGNHISFSFQSTECGKKKNIKKSIKSLPLLLDMEFGKNIVCKKKIKQKKQMKENFAIRNNIKQGRVTSLSKASKLDISKQELFKALTASSPTFSIQSIIQNKSMKAKFREVQNNSKQRKLVLNNNEYKFLYKNSTSKINFKFGSLKNIKSNYKIRISKPSFMKLENIEIVPRDIITKSIRNLRSKRFIEHQTHTPASKRISIFQTLTTCTNSTSISSKKKFQQSDLNEILIRKKNKLKKN